ncbi:MAG: NFYB/HAP3 family transcription factor subunit [Nanoarchaeota archaeon]|nr:NFYB/HAP3 family transcription factor subunit [Nanoarchaeota archaeon]
MNKKSIKYFVEKEKKKIGVEAIKKINVLVEDYVEKIVKKACRNADFAGRKILKEEDIK